MGFPAIDRFLMHVRIDYPEASAEQEILALARQQALGNHGDQPAVAELVSEQQIFDAQQVVLNLHVAEPVRDYMVELVLASRNPDTYGEDLTRWIQFGASPRGTIALDRCARAHAWLQGRDYVSPADVHAIAHDVLRHRILLSYEAEAEGVTPDDAITALLERVATP